MAHILRNTYSWVLAALLAVAVSSTGCGAKKDAKDSDAKSPKGAPSEKEMKGMEDEGGAKVEHPDSKKPGKGDKPTGKDPAKKPVDKPKSIDPEDLEVPPDPLEKK